MTGLLLIGCDDECDGLKGEAAEPAVIRIENQTSAPLYLPTYCGSGPLVFIDDDGVLNSWDRYSCDDVLANRCPLIECYPDQGAIEILPSGAYEPSWSGHLLADAPIDVPDECRPDCTDYGVEVLQCHRRVAAAPGEHTVTGWYVLSPQDVTYSPAYQEFSATFTWPTTKVTVAITTP